ncbi:MULTISPECIES: thiamine ABC transporter substrate-binding protein [unclassified Haladaptatus]|uniref:thiamine ABC transporter substrate-binding protein n=1 Tax=unclassified Haladaptatus TaxID=2622732 RepID=UPI00209C3DF4|nr:MULTISPECIES: thiamine ABC transporter substrate-binding protein [unclassified Haladaptatus]MCO8242698.1 thiamine ABC transporter substrate-binding protein [Haladaptatus sp. AB643]MCO8252457.1 thiamine ABC transporter substrate-binding protein [Haladaptatus sp. AB618]
MKRRTYLTATGTAFAGLAGCLGNSDDSGSSGDSGSTSSTGGKSAKTTSQTQLSGTLNVATYSALVDAPSTSPGAWLKKEFEKKYPKATLKWQTPDSEVNYYIQRKAQHVDIDADVYVGLNVDQLITIDQKLGGTKLFTPVTDSLSNYGHVKKSLNFDPKGRAVPYDTGYVSLVYDETKVDNPGSFDALTKPKFKGTLLTENAQQAATGRAFLLWTIHEMGEKKYLDYWSRLSNNDTQILGSWDAAYTAYSNGERPIVVSYSTDQVYAHREGENMKKHQIGFLNGQGYANPEGMAKFADTDSPKLADAFLDFMLSKKAQSKIAQLNVAFPSTDWADLGKEFDKYAKEPDEPVTYSYDQLKGNLEGWVDEWARQIASK